MTSDGLAVAEESLERAVEAGALPGASFVVTGPDGDAAEVHAGKLRFDRDKPVTSSTMYRLMSMTKALVAVGALQLIEQERLGLDQEVASVVPQFADLNVLEGFDGDRPRLRAPRSGATIRQLLTHTSGLGYSFQHPDLLRFHEITGVPDPLSGRRSSLGAPLIADPGTAWNYSISYDWLGQVIEKVSGQDLDAYLHEHLFEPLGMIDTTFAPSDEQHLRLMAVHARTADGRLVITDLDLPPKPEFYGGGHGAYSTALDYARFMAALLGGGQLEGTRILEAATVELMFTDQLGGIPMPDGSTSTVPELSNDVPPLPFSHTFGLGLHVFTEDLPGMRRAGSGDWSGLCNCYYWIDRTSEVAGAFLTQVLPFYDAQVLQPVLETEQAVYAEILAPT